MYKVVENRKCTLWPQTDLEHLSVKITAVYFWILSIEAQISFDQLHEEKVLR